jgi:hypothetical protein
LKFINSNQRVAEELTRVEGMAGKLIELAREIMPAVNRIGVLGNVTNPTNEVQRRKIETAGARLSVTAAGLRNSDRVRLAEARRQNGCDGKRRRRHGSSADVTALWLLERRSWSGFSSPARTRQ